MAAVSQALDQGADGVEIDVWLVADGTLVCAHDLAGADVTSLATLPELLAAAQRPAGARVVVEAKPVADAAVARATADALAAVLRTSAGTADITISSFDADLLATIRATCADLPVRTALLGEKSAAGRRGRRAGPPATDTTRCTSPLVAVRRSPLAVTTARGWACRSRSGRSTAGTTCSWAAELGVDAVITDDVLVARD